MFVRRGESGLLFPEPGIQVARVTPATLNPGEDFTGRATLQCYYKFENSGDLGLDTQGNIALTNNNSVAQSSTLPSGTYAAPTAANSADFELDSTMSLSANHDDSSEIDNLTAMTTVFWIKPESVPSQTVYVSKASGFSDGFIFFTVSSGATSRDYFAGSNYVETGWSDISSGTWFFVAISYSQANDEQRVYQGTEEVQVSLQGTPATLTDETGDTTGGFKIGGFAWQGGSEYDGLMCEVAILSEELSLSELQDIQEFGMDGSG